MPQLRWLVAGSSLCILQFRAVHVFVLQKAIFFQVFRVPLPITVLTYESDC
jgi:hypothetical protein